VKPAQKRKLVEFLIICFKIGKRRACELIRLNRSTMYYQSQAKDQSALTIRLRDLAASRVRYGYRRLHVLLQREGWKVNSKRVYRIYVQEGLSLRLKKNGGKKRIAAARVPCPPATAPNERWSMDFMSDRLSDGRRFRVLTLVDNFSRVSPALEAGISLSGKFVASVLERLAAKGLKPKTIHVDNGPEFVSRALDDWAHRNGVKLDFSRPGKPTDNPFIESFNGRLRVECLDQNWYNSIEEARSGLEAFRIDHNQVRPHTALGMKTPDQFVAEWEAAKDQTLGS
jgi:putative transposase